MKITVFKNRKNTLKNVLAGFAPILVASLLLTGCSAARTTVTQAAQEPQYELSDDCALIHIYRVGRMAGAAIGYDIYLGDEVVYRARNNSKTTIRLTEEGAVALWAKTESRTDLPLEIQLGREYYVRCGMRMGVMVGRPVLEIMEGSTGKAEFDKIPPGK